MKRLLLILVLLITSLSPQGASATPPVEEGVQAFLDRYPGSLKQFSEDGHSAATIIEGTSLYYGVSPRLLLSLLETTNALLSTPNPSQSALMQPFGTLGPYGFTKQIDWASRELRAGLGPYRRPPVVRFTDGVTVALTLNQAMEGVAVQRFLAQGRGIAAWRVLVERFNNVFNDYFNNELPPFPPPSTALPASDFTLFAPWIIGTRVGHLSYFDHAYPTVDSVEDGNDMIINYLGQSNVQYDEHDGHDYTFPDLPIGTPILAAAAGTAYARSFPGNGVVIVHPGGYETVYWHLDGFAPIFDGVVDTNQGTRVEIGQQIGTSGATGFVSGTPHLHFEVRLNGREFDPYGWYGEGADPCPAYAGCATSTWLWDASLVGTYDFTPPSVVVDTTPPIGMLAVNPPNELRMLVPFDGHTVQQIGGGFAVADGTPSFIEGRYGQALLLSGERGLTYPTYPHLDPAEGTMSLWVKVPESVVPMSTGRHYLFATSANPDDTERIYTNTLALRHEFVSALGDAPFWTFWTASDQGEWDELRVPDSLSPGWHHIAITWDRVQRRKAIYLDGVMTGSSENVALPDTFGDVIQLGRFTYGATAASLPLDDLASYQRVLSDTAILAIAQAPTAIVGSSSRVHNADLLLDINAADEQSSLVAVQLGRDGVFEDPQPYYDAFRWSLPARDATYTIAVRITDSANNSTVVTQSIILDQPPRLSAYIAQSNDIQATLIISSTDEPSNLSMQVGPSADLDEIPWQPFQTNVVWVWQAGLPRRLYVRLRDSSDQRSAIIEVREPLRTYIPFINP